MLPERAIRGENAGVYGGRQRRVSSGNRVQWCHLLAGLSAAGKLQVFVCFYYIRLLIK